MRGAPLVTALTASRRRDSCQAEVPIALQLREQRRIVAKLDALTERSRRAKAALDAIPPLIEKFKQSVLAAAFRGDLTADWRAAHPDVEPASELFKRIRVERRRRWEEAELAKLTAKGKAPTDDRWKAKYEEPEAVDASELPELPRSWCWASTRRTRAS
jgi:type I restriction enzyme S subunit